MKKFIFLFLIVLMNLISLASAKTVSVDVPFEYKYGLYNESHIYFELINDDTEYPYKKFIWANGSESSDKWDMKYFFDSEEVCNESTCPEDVCEYKFDFGEEFYNMTESLKLMIGAFNETYNLSMEIIEGKNETEMLGICLGRNIELENQSINLVVERDSIQEQLNTAKPYENLYNSCQNNLMLEKKNVQTWGVGGAIVGGILVYFFITKKKGISEHEEEGYE